MRLPREQRRGFRSGWGAAFVALIALAGGCGDPSSGGFTEGACAEVTCSGNGHCELDGTLAVCVCDPGFVPQGLDCVDPSVGPCATNPCTTPPTERSCAGTTLLLPPDEGSCVVDVAGVARCVYTPTERDCAAEGLFCRGGACVAGASCTPNPCTVPPADVCDGPTTALQHAAEGACTVDAGTGEASCVYAPTTVDCAGNGELCESGSCIEPDGPCNPNPCLDPPPPSCAGHTTLHEHPAPGTCDDDSGAPVCIYPARPRDCAAEGLVCSEGACVPTVSPCNPNPCLDPPPAGCDGTVASTYPASGDCTEQADAFTCAYEATVTDCADAGQVCQGGRCQTPGDPCDPNPCTPTPTAFCDDTVLHTFANDPGLCAAAGAGPTCDYGAQEQDCATGGQACADGACVTVLPRPVEGDLVITEIMYNPSGGVDDNDGEWFELRNVSGQTLDIGGVTFTEAGGSSFTLPADVPLILAAGARFLLAREADLGTPDAGITADHVYTGFSLNNSAESITVTVGGVTLDAVAYDEDADWPSATAASLSLDPASATAEANDLPESWCVATAAYDPTTGNAGSPGGSNEQCQPLDPCTPNPCDEPPASTCAGTVLTSYTLSPGTCTPDGESHTCDYGEQTTDCAAGGGSCDAGACVGSTAVPPAAGEIVIIEIHSNPSTSSDQAGEWFEVVNVGDETVDLSGVLIADDGSDAHTIVGPVLLAPGAYAVLGRVGDTATNGGVSLDYVYGTGVTLGNGDDELILSYGETLLDAVRYDPGDETNPFVDPANGHSLRFGGAPDADANDVGSAWCEERTATYGVGDFGTPGAPNAPCP